MQLGDFRLTGRIGEGGMGAVYEANQQKLNRRVAIKVLANRLAKDEVFLERFKREARAAASINHPGLIQVFDIGSQDGVHYYAMEYVDGEDLSQRLKREGSISEAEAIEIVIHAAEALQEAHDQSVVHRDIKPENILITSKGQVKVADLGLAKILEDETSMTLTGTGMGSPHFMAPEQAEDACHVDHRVDIYSLGITLLMLVTGRRPYSATSPYLLARAHAEQPLPSGKDLGKDLSPEIERLIRKMAAKLPGERYQNYEELLEDLRHLKGDQQVSIAPAKTNEKIRELFRQMDDREPSDIDVGPSAFPSASAVPVNSEAPGKPWFPITMGVGVLALLAIAIQQVNRSSPRPPPSAANDNMPPTNLVVAPVNPPPVFRNQVPPDPSLPARPEELEALSFLMGNDRPSAPSLPESIIGVLFPSRTMQESLIYYLPTGDPMMISPRNLGGPADATGVQLMKRASAYAAKNPTDYRMNMINYVAAHRRAPDLQMQEDALHKVNEYAAALEKEARREMKRMALDMILLVEEGRPAAAYNIWRQFPPGLNLYKLQPEIYDLIGTNVPASHFGSDYGITPIPGNKRPHQVKKQYPNPKFHGYRPHREMSRPN